MVLLESNRLGLTVYNNDNYRFTYKFLVQFVMDFRSWKSLHYGTTAIDEQFSMKYFV